MELLDLKYIEEIADGDNKLKKELCEIFISQTDEILQIITEAVNDADYETVRKAAHKIKSSLRTFGVRGLANEFENIETKKNLCEDDINKIIDFKNKTVEVIEEVKEYLKTLRI